LRICFISSYPPKHARLSEYAENLVRELTNRPLVSKVYMLVDTVNGSKGKFVKNSKLEVWRVWNEDNALSILSILWYLLKLKPDIVQFNVHFQSYGKTRLANFAGFFLVFLTRLFNFKVTVLLHNIAEKVDLEKVRLKPSIVNKVGILLATKLILTSSSMVVTVRSYAKYLENRYGHKGLKYIPHGTSANHRLSIDKKEKVVLMFGHMGPSKGLPVMFRAFEEINKERNDVKLVVAGDSHPNFPGYLDELIRVAPPQVDFLGYVQEKDLETLFGFADVVVLPYYTATGTSGVFHLACGYGKPIVASSLPEIKELVDEGASALLVPIGDVVALKGAIMKVLFSPDLASKMCEQNLMFARQEDWSVVAKAYEDVYLELLNVKRTDKS
jgi:glycosyltransferase involved in cell wall biosynthesis